MQVDRGFLIADCPSVFLRNTFNDVYKRQIEETAQSDRKKNDKTTIIYAFIYIFFMLLLSHPSIHDFYRVSVEPCMTGATKISEMMYEYIHNMNNH